MTILTKEAMYDVVRSVGAEQDVDQAMCTGALAESGWNTQAVGDNGHSIGLFQMHDQGLGAGMSVAERSDPVVSSTAMLPHYRTGLYDAAAEGYVDRELIVQACLRAERPYDWQNPMGEAASRYRAAYYDALPPESPPVAPPSGPGTTYDPSVPAVRQSAPWNCACASTTWGLLALGFAVTEAGVTGAMVAAGLVTPDLGLLDGSGAQLAGWLEAQVGLRVERQWPGDWDALTPWVLPSSGPLLAGGSNWYHWSAVRGGDADGLVLANPAPSWQGVGDHMNKAEWDTFGPWAVLWLPATG